RFQAGEVGDRECRIPNAGQEPAIGASGRECTVQEVEPQPYVPIEWIGPLQTWSSASHKDVAGDLGHELDVPGDAYRYPAAEQELAAKVKQGDAMLLDIAGMNVPDILVPPEAMASALLAKHQDRSAFPYSICPAASHSVLVRGDRHLDVPAERHAEPVCVGIDQTKLGSEIKIAGSVG